ncbi:MAG TPA: gamma-glutamyltransferase [Chloroflexota bacterium]|nr:gamma-glutamyltransferase [Chloroflexota bacterium]
MTHNPGDGTGQRAFATRPVLRGTLGMVAAGHYLASATGLRLLEQGGNAVDAAAAAGFALAVLKPQENGLGGEAPILIHLARPLGPGTAAGAGRSLAINGQGWAPRRATIGWFREQGIGAIPPDGFLPATVPGAFGSWCTALLCAGTASLADVLGPAVALAEGGFPLDAELRERIARLEGRFRREWPSSAAVYLPHDRVPDEGALLRNAQWAATMKGALDVAAREAGRGREASIRAAMDYFYKGPVAERAVAFTAARAVRDASGRAHRGLFSVEDWAAYGERGTRVEPPVRLTYRGVEVLKCGPWSQGPVLLQQLKLLEGYDLTALGHNTAPYLHLLIEGAKLAFADRERYYGDPAFTNVPLAALLSDAYAAARRRLIDPQRASLEQRPGEVAPQGSGDGAQDGAHIGDTTHVDVVDRWGNLCSATPSGGWIPSSPVVPGLGFPLGTRGQLFRLDERHANGLAPRKRPRTTLTPSLALRDGQPWLAFGTPGGDMQDQWALQVFLNLVDFGMDLQAAVDAPTVHTRHFPSSFYPQEALPGRVHVEGRVPLAVREALAALGHEVHVDDDWNHGQPSVVAFEPRHGVVAGAASARTSLPYVMGR